MGTGHTVTQCADSLPDFPGEGPNSIRVLLDTLDLSDISSVCGSLRLVRQSETSGSVRTVVTTVNLIIIK